MIKHAKPVALGGPVLTAPVVGLLALAALGMALIACRFAVGLGASTAMNDGYAWGIWIAFDVVTGTALGCGGYVVAILVYLLNEGRYHPLVRPAVLTSALGYSIAGFSVLLDLGRPWLTWKIPVLVNHWNGHSQLLEVALCIMAYTIVLWIELLPAMLARAAESTSAFLRKLSGAMLPVVRRSLVFVTAFGVLLPTMHQSSLGSLLLLSGPRLHPLWNTPILPLLFLLSCVLMGLGAVVCEGLMSTRFAVGRPADTRVLVGLEKMMLATIALFVGIRFVELVARGGLPLLAGGGVYAAMWWAETLLMLLVAWMVSSDERRRDPSNAFLAAFLLAFSGALYRFDVFLLAFQPGPGWHYFPSVAEILITVGLVAAEIAIFIIFVRLFPILTEEPAEAIRAAMAPSAARGLS